MKLRFKEGAKAGDIMKTLTFPDAAALLVALCCVTEVFGGAVDRSFRLGAGLAGGDEEGGHCIVPLADGRLLVGGDFGTYNRVTRPDPTWSCSTPTVHSTKACIYWAE
jgi:hypothetical protein